MEQTVFVGLIELNISDPAAILKPDFLPGTLPPNPRSQVEKGQFATPEATFGVTDQFQPFGHWVTELVD